MGEFFNGWRRKSGLVTLAMALLSTVAWMRSYVIRDKLEIVPHPHCLHAIVSGSGRLVWQRLVSTDMPFLHYDFPFVLHSSDGPEGDDLAWYRREVEWRLEGSGFDFGAVHSFTGNVRAQFAKVPYWSLVLPLTLLSAWLILIKPRKEERSP